MGDSVLIIALDGLDTEYIERYNLSFTEMTDYGGIDNHTGMKDVVTSELFASFLTGVTWKEHGVTGLRGWDSSVLNTVERIVPKNRVFLRIGKWGKNILECVGRTEKHIYTKNDLEQETFLDTVRGGTTVNVPSYDQNAFLDIYTFTMNHFGIEATAREAEKEFQKRKEEFWDVFKDNPPLLMAHFHYPDAVNHLFGDVVEDEERLRTAYERIDAFAQKILEKADGVFDTVLFMSDHGMPTPTAHNENAFYACTRPLPMEEPHITDFRAIIEDWCGVEEDELAGVDI